MSFPICWWRQWGGRRRERERVAFPLSSSFSLLSQFSCKISCAVRAKLEHIPLKCNKALENNWWTIWSWPMFMSSCAHLYTGQRSVMFRATRTAFFYAQIRCVSAWDAVKSDPAHTFLLFRYPHNTAQCRLKARECRGGRVREWIDRGELSPSTACHLTTLHNCWPPAVRCLWWIDGSPLLRCHGVRPIITVLRGT